MNNSDTGLPPTGREISSRQFGKRLIACIAEVEQEQITLTITRDGKPVACLVPHPAAAQGETGDVLPSGSTTTSRPSESR